MPDAPNIPEDAAAAVRFAAARAAAASPIGGDRPRRFCDVCTNADDHPRHGHVLPDGTLQTRHFDCCRAAGCPDGTCDAWADSGAADLRGADLLAHIQGA